MRFGFTFGENPSPWERWMEQGLTRVLIAHGHRITDGSASADVMFHRVDPMRPRAYRRQYQATFVVGLVEGTEGTPPLKTLYPLLIRSISNLLIYGGFTSANQVRVTMATPELGYYTVASNPGIHAWFEAIYERIAPLAESHLVIDNVFDEDLPEALWNGVTITNGMRDAAQTLDRWELFPTPFPMADVLPADDMRHLRHLFGIGGLSYGNLSARHDEEQFWMSASGVDKGKIGVVSRDILLVKTYDPTIRAMRLSVRPGSDPLRVSVDAVEHWGVYRRHPEIGAIIHIHAWVDGVATTTVNYPCGTVEMGDAMSDLLDREQSPERTIIGLKNHGITATGPTFQDILERLEGRVRPTVPMQ